MNVLYYNFLTATLLSGILWLSLIFGLCFLSVHIARLVRLGWLYQKNALKPTEQEQPSTEKKETAPQPKPSAEPVYYIVERKRKPRQASYGTPKEIRFK